MLRTWNQIYKLWSKKERETDTKMAWKAWKLKHCFITHFFLILCKKCLRELQWKELSCWKCSWHKSSCIHIFLLLVFLFPFNNHGNNRSETLKASAYMKRAFKRFWSRLSVIASFPPFSLGTKRRAECNSSVVVLVSQTWEAVWAFF